jgi:Tol biopolymer transport system component
MAPDGKPLDDRESAERYYRLAWSPAGDRFLLERLTQQEGDPGASAIFFASLGGTELRQVTPASSQAPDWSSTGRIAFARTHDRSCPYGCSDVYVTRRGGTPRRLTFHGGLSPSWSPHGTKLAFAARGSGAARATSLS